MQDKPIKEIETADFIVTAKDNIMPTVLQRYNANKSKTISKNSQINDLFDDDVLEILSNLPNTPKDRQIINGLIRAVYA